MSAARTALSEALALTQDLSEAHHDMARLAEALYATADENGVLDDAAADAWADALQVTVQRVPAVVATLDQLQAAMDTCKERIAALRKLHAALERANDRTRQRIADVVDESGKIETDHVLVYIMAGRARVRVDPGLSEIDILDLPADVVKTTVSVDKRAALALLKAGKCLPGLSLVDGEPALVIRKRGAS